MRENPFVRTTLLSQPSTSCYNSSALCSVVFCSVWIKLPPLPLFSLLIIEEPIDPSVQWTQIFSDVFLDSCCIHTNKKNLIYYKIWFMNVFVMKGLRRVNAIGQTLVVIPIQENGYLTWAQIHSRRLTFTSMKIWFSVGGGVVVEGGRGNIT